MHICRNHLHVTQSSANDLMVYICRYCQHNYTVIICSAVIYCIWRNHLPYVEIICVFICICCNRLHMPGSYACGVIISIWRGRINYVDAIHEYCCLMLIAFKHLLRCRHDIMSWHNIMTSQRHGLSIWRHVISDTSTNYIFNSNL